MDRYWKPALMAGIIRGIVSAVPVVNFLNCCCLWIVGAIVWAAFMFKSKYGYLDIGPGAALGAITGAIMGFVSGFLNIIVWAILGNWYRAFMFRMIQNFNVPAEAMKNMHMMGYTGLSAITGIFTTAAIGAIVGLIMGAIWRKPPEETIGNMPEQTSEQLPPTPPPPPTQ